jgi:predicted dehydrogenase
MLSSKSASFTRRPMGLAAELHAEPEPVRFAIVGLVHDHARGFIPMASARKDIQLVAIVEAARYARDYRLPDTLFHTSTFDHRRVVEACARRGVHVMMEKPLAVDMEHARAIASAAKEGGVQVLVNFETTWYPANHEAYDQVHDQNAVGELRKIVVRDGHQGPKEIGQHAASSDREAKQIGIRHLLMPHQADAGSVLFSLANRCCNGRLMSIHVVDIILLRFACSGG